jgi:flavorubredoxin
LKYAAVLNSYGWSPGAIKQANEFFGSLKIEVVGSIELNGPPTASDQEKIIELGRQLSSKVKGK